jgi:hypothetical protein
MQEGCIMPNESTVNTQEGCIMPNESAVNTQEGCIMEICEITSSMFPEDATGKVFGKYRINHGSSWDTEIGKYITSRRPVTYEETTRRFEVEIESYLNLTFSFRMVAAGEYRITIGELYANMYFFTKVTSDGGCVRNYIDPFIYYGFSKYVDPKLTLKENF